MDGTSSGPSHFTYRHHLTLIQASLITNLLLVWLGDAARLPYGQDTGRRPATRRTNCAHSSGAPPRWNTVADPVSGNPSHVTHVK